MTSPRDDRELIAAWLNQGDERAFEELCERHVEIFWRIARRLVRDRREAEDALQEAQTAIWTDIADLRDWGKFRGWACKVVANACRDHHRRWRRTPMPVEAPPNCPDGLSTEQQAELRVVVADALNRLPSKQAVVIALVDMDGLTIGYAAEILQITDEAAKSRRRRGLVQMAKALGHLRASDDDPNPRSPQRPTP